MLDGVGSSGNRKPRMDTRKRSFGSDVAGEVMMLDSSDSTLLHNNSCLSDAAASSRDQHKRVQTISRAVGSLSQQEVAQFIHKLSPYLPAHPQVLQTHAGLDAAGLQAFAELNTVLHQHFKHVSGDMLNGYHSFTIQDRQR